MARDYELHVTQVENRVLAELRRGAQPQTNQDGSPKLDERGEQIIAYESVEGAGDWTLPQLFDDPANVTDEQVFDKVKEQVKLHRRRPTRPRRVDGSGRTIRLDE